MAEHRTVNPWVVGSSPTLGAMTQNITNPIIGKRIQLIFCDDDYTKLQSGELGTVTFIDDTGTVFVDWDNGSRLGLIPNIDKWKIIHG